MRLHRMFAGKGRIFFIGAALLSAAPFVHAADLPVTIKTNPNVQATIGTINQFVQGRMADLADATPARRTDGRDSLTRQVESVNGIAPDPAFLEAYSGAIAVEVQGVLKKPDPAVRMNAAIVVSRVINVTHSKRLADLIPQILGDESPAVTIYGLKCADAVINDIYNGPNPAKSPLLPAIVSAVKKHKNYGMIARDAYRVIATGPAANVAVPKLPPAGMAAMIDTMNAILAARVQIYAADFPADAIAETHPAALLSSGGVMGVMTPAEKLETVQNLADLIVLTAGRSQSTNPALRADAQYQIIRSAQALRQVLGSMSVTTANGQIAAIAGSTGSNVSSLPAQAQEVHTLLEQDKALAGLKPAPEMQPGTDKAPDKSEESAGR